MLVAALLLAVGVTACSRDASSSLPRPSKPFCEAAHRYDVRIDEARRPSASRSALVQRMADHAPKDIADDAQTFLDALERRGRRRQVRRRQPQDQRRGRQREPPSAAEGCDLYKQDTRRAGSDDARGALRRGRVRVRRPRVRSAVSAGASPAAADEITGGCTALVNGQDGALAHEGRPARGARRRAGRDHRQHPGGVRAAEPDEQRRRSRSSVIDGLIDVTSDEQESVGPIVLGRRRERRRLLRRRRRPLPHRGHEPRRQDGDCEYSRVPAARGGHALGPDRARSRSPRSSSARSARSS